MEQEIPKVYVNKIDKVCNNQELFCSYKDYPKEEQLENNFVYDEYQMQGKIDELFRSNDFIYKKKFHIKTKYSEGDYEIISKSYDYLLTITGEKIYINNIIEIK